jgi:hypothetical protein
MADHICSFCKKSSRAVSLIVAGPGVNICDECVVLCVEVIAETARRRAATVPLCAPDQSFIKLETDPETGMAILPEGFQEQSPTASFGQQDRS